MDDAVVMGGLECLRNLPGNGERLVDWNRSARDSLVETLAIDQFQHEEGVVIRLVETVDCADVRMVQRGEDLRLPPESCDALRVAGKGCGQEFERHLATELR